jgi:ELWxxDGT repeat protein
MLHAAQSEADMFENRSQRVQKSDTGGGLVWLLCAAIGTAACGSPLPASATPPTSGPTPYPPGDPSAITPYLVRDVNPGPASSFDDPLAGKFFAAPFGTLFVANDGRHGLELWITDATAPGTRLVADICPGQCSSNPGWFTRWGHEILFQATDEEHGQELWASDGSAAGTRLVADIRPGRESGAPTMFVPYGRVLLLNVLGADYADELWTTDGSPTGTRFVREISPPRQTSAQGHWVAAAGLVFFGVDDGAVGHELWATDGTAEGTRLVRDICPGPCDSLFALHAVTFDDVLYFSASDHDGGAAFLWRSDGTERGTWSLGVLFEGDARAVAAGSLFIAAGEFFSERELWKTDGTRRGTARVSTIEPGLARRGMIEWRGRLLLSASDRVRGQELWTTDGTADGTVILKDINPGAASSSPYAFTPHGGRLFFAASDDGGHELWQTDGSVEGTIRIEIRRGPESGLSTRYFGGVGSTGDRIVFIGTDGQAGDELWAYAPR